MCGVTGSAEPKRWDDARADARSSSPRHHGPISEGQLRLATLNGRDVLQLHSRLATLNPDVLFHQPFCIENSALIFKEFITTANMRRRGGNQRAVLRFTAALI